MPMQVGEWNGFRDEEFEFEGMEAHIVFPHKDSNQKLVIKTEYRHAFPDTEIALLQEGYTVAFCANPDRWGSDECIEFKNRFINYMIEKYDFQSKCVLVGMSCGGLIAIKLAAKYPEHIGGLYLDAPVLNFMSCPCGFGIGNPLDPDGDSIREILNALHMSTISELLCYRKQPLDCLDALLSQRIPTILVAGDSDTDVPYVENGKLLETEYLKTDIPFEVYVKAGCAHHPHGLEDPHKVVQFIQKYC